MAPTRRFAWVCALTVAAAAAACQRVPLLAPTGSTITLTASATALPSSGTTQLIAQVLESAGTPPHTGTHVIFTTTLGVIDPSETETDINGRAIVTFKANGANGTATITASSGGAVVAAANALKISLGTAAVGSLQLTASPTTIAASGGSSTITATVFDSSGNVIAGVPVSFTNDFGSLNPSSVNTDANGVARTVLTTNRTSKVTATAGVATTSGTTTTAAPTKDVTVTVNTTNTISVGTISPASPTAGQTVSIALTYPGTASPLTKVTVNWGDGATDTFAGQPAAVSHKFASAGSYLVLLTGSDAFGDTTTSSAAITVSAPAKPTVTIQASSNPTVGTVTIFTISATATTGNVITSVFVDFGDGSSVSLPGNATSVQHSYSSAGTFTVTAVATDSNGASNSGSTVIVVGANAVANFQVTPASPTRNSAATFDGSSSTSSATINSYAWNFGDGTTGSGVTFSKTYTTAGTFTATLTITDSAGRSATTSKQITVLP